MANNQGSVDATFYAQVEPEYGRWDNESVIGAKVVRISQKKPASPIGGTVTVKLTIRVPKVAFGPLAPEAIVVVPTDLTEAHPITVTAEEPA